MKQHPKTCPVAQAVCVCPLPETTEEIVITNDLFVGSQGGRIGWLLQPTEPMPPEDALRFAAWLVLVANGSAGTDGWNVDAEERFSQILEAIKRGN